MAWLWNSWEDYAKQVHPNKIRRGMFNVSLRETRQECIQTLLHHLEILRNAVVGLLDLAKAVEDGFNVDGAAPIGAVRLRLEGAVYAGECVLLYSRRLAFHRSARAFLEDRDCLDLTGRFGQSELVIQELRPFAKCCQDLLDGYIDLARADRELFILDLPDLPKDLVMQFQRARDLFSVGFEQEGLFVTGRAFEDVLRRVLKKRKVQLQSGQRVAVLAAEADLHDVIEVIGRLRWTSRGEGFVSKSDKALLHLLRTVRNNVAHSATDSEMDRPRELASTAAAAANRLWSQSLSKAKLGPAIVLKSW